VLIQPFFENRACPTIRMTEIDLVINGASPTALKFVLAINFQKVGAGAADSLIGDARGVTSYYAQSFSTVQVSAQPARHRSTPAQLPRAHPRAEIRPDLTHALPSPADAHVRLSCVPATGANRREIL
jgi:hypothetical protein